MDRYAVIGLGLFALFLTRRQIKESAQSGVISDLKFYYYNPTAVEFVETNVRDGATYNGDAMGVQIVSLTPAKTVRLFESPTTQSAMERRQRCTWSRSCPRANQERTTSNRGIMGEPLWVLTQWTSLSKCCLRRPVVYRRKENPTQRTASHTGCEGGMNGPSSVLDQP